ncbi:MAG: DUF4058 family protein [Synechococcales cyanobacterium RM1_1_8]|nr:DUF4058 family protein [Synechococcales cyanobacterium RM1_1_8]
MPSPFPGMDPYLEGYLWPDVHSALASKIRQQLVPQLRPRYTARLEVYVTEDNAPEGEIGILYPDVQVLDNQQIAKPVQPELDSRIAILPAPVTVPVVHPVAVRLTRVEIRDTAQNKLIACIEILSPVNKREPGITDYRRKRQQLYQAGIHLLELDLLRRGTRPFAHPQLPESSYGIALTRAGSRCTEVWPLQLADPLPTVPLPLREPDGEVALDLDAALRAIYDEAAYDLSIDYGEAPPPPKLSDAEMLCMKKSLL